MKTFLLTILILSTSIPVYASSPLRRGFTPPRTGRPTDTVTGGTRVRPGFPVPADDPRPRRTGSAGSRFTEDPLTSL